MPTALEYMKFSLNVYDASVTNLIGVPFGWHRHDWQPPKSMGSDSKINEWGQTPLILKNGYNQVSMSLAALFKMSASHVLPHKKQ